MIARRRWMAAVAVLTALALAGCSASGLKRTASRAEAHPVIVTIGDSIMAGNGLADGEDWPSLLAAEDGLDLTNLACSGAGFIAVGGCGKDFAGIIPAAVKLRPTVVIVQSSSNDIGSSQAQIQQATSTTMASLRLALPRARIIGLSTIWNDHSDLPDEIGWSSDALQSSMTTVSGRFIDVGQPLLGHPEWMQSDDVHPTLAGQEAILEQIRFGLLDHRDPG